MCELALTVTRCQAYTTISSPVTIETCVHFVTTNSTTKHAVITQHYVCILSAVSSLRGV